MAREVFPVEIWLQICKQVSSQATLAALAQTCQDVLLLAEEALYKDVTIRNPTSLRCFLRALKTHPLRTQLVHSLTLTWPESMDRHKVAETFASVLSTLSHPQARIKRISVRMSSERDTAVVLHSFEFALLVHGRVVLPPSIRALEGSATILRTLVAPHAPLTAISVRTRITELSKLSPLLAPFRDTLKRLRIERHMPWCVRHDNPARVCAMLDTPRLEYLEVRDVVPNKRVCRSCVIGLNSETHIESCFPTDETPL